MSSTDLRYQLSYSFLADAPAQNKRKKSDVSNGVLSGSEKNMPENEAALYSVTSFRYPDHEIIIRLRQRLGIEKSSSFLRWM